MTKQEIFQFLANCKETHQNFLNICFGDEEILKVVDIENAKTNIDIINLWIDDVIDDINKDLIPDTFFGKLKHDVEHNIPTQYYTSFRPNESKLLSFKSISEQLSGREFGIIDTPKKLNRQLEKVADSFGNIADI